MRSEYISIGSIELSFGLTFFHDTKKLPFHTGLRENDIWRK